MSVIQRRRMMMDGALPPWMVKIDGGTFHADPDTWSEGITLYHNLGVVPHGLVIYSKNTKSRGDLYNFDVADTFFLTLNANCKNADDPGAINPTTIHICSTSTKSPINVQYGGANATVLRKYTDRIVITGGICTNFAPTTEDYYWLVWAGEDVDE